MSQLHTARWIVVFVSLLVLLSIPGTKVCTAENVFSDPEPTSAQRAKAGFEAVCRAAADRADKIIDAARTTYAAELKAVLDRMSAGGNADEIGRLNAEIDAARTGGPNSDKPRNPAAVTAFRKFERAYTTANEERRRSQEAAKRQYLADLTNALATATKANDPAIATQLKADLDRLRRESLEATLGQDAVRPDEPAKSPATRSSVPVDSGQGLRCELFNGENFEKKVAERIDPNIDFWWCNGSPADGVNPDHFSIRWSGFLRSPRAGQYKLILQGDDGFRLKLDGKVVIDLWKGNAGGRQHAMVQLTGQPQAIEVEYFDGRWGAQLSLLWQGPGDKQESVLPEQYLFRNEKAAAASKLLPVRLPVGEGVLLTLFSDQELKNAVGSDAVRDINRTFGLGHMVGPFQQNLFSARWRAFLTAPEKGRYRLITGFAGAARVYYDGKLLIDQWTPPTASEQVLVEFGDEPKEIVVEYRNLSTYCFFTLHWEKVDGFTEQIIPASAFSRTKEAAKRARPAPK